ncbi:MAG: hypothetical protein RLZZ399_289 [Verrucomicrobiota bacterium]|jgi:protein TonB
MIRTPKEPLAHLASAWVAGIASLFLAVGSGGLLTPITPPILLGSGTPPQGDRILVEQDFAPPPEQSTEAAPQDNSIPVPTADVQIPPLPEITPPLQAPEMLEIQPVEPPQERTPPPAASPKTPEPKPAPQRPAAPSKSPSSSTNARAGGSPGGTGSPVLFSGAGGGRFPSLGYPSSARSARIEGTVRLLVTVESSGVPTSVSIESSSGHTVLDNTARDHVRRNWRWPSGDTRLFIVPIKFVLK